MDGVAAAYVVGGSVCAHGLEGACDGGIGNFGGTEVVHGGGVAPVGLDSRVGIEQALVTARHDDGDCGVGVGQSGLVGISGVDVGGPECHARHLGADATGVARRAGRTSNIVLHTARVCQ